MPYPYVIQYAESCTKSITVNGKSQRINDVVDQAHYLINVPLIKNHGNAGATFSMKNHYGSVNNPGALQHNNYCRDDIPALQLAEWVDAYARTTSLLDKTAAIVSDALFMMYTGGPTGGSAYRYNTILVGNNMVGMDARCLEILNQVRSDNGRGAVLCPSIDDAELLGIGTKDLQWVDLINPSDQPPPSAEVKQWEMY
jgi:uncharacterized protein (DUF362 family)